MGVGAAKGKLQSARGVACALDEDAKVGRLLHRLVAEGRAVGVLGAVFVFEVVGELPHPLRVVPLERGQPDVAQVLGVRIGMVL